jgi:hypothetical protein
MNAPDRIHAWPHSEDGWAYGICSDKLTGPTTGAAYTRRDPAALAADELVLAMIGAVVEWLPIDTAPYDTPLLAKDANDADAIYKAMRIRAEHPDDRDHFQAHCGQPVVYPPEPTHWMPLRPDATAALAARDARIRAEALEDAAKVAERQFGYEPTAAEMHMCVETAAAIRALKGETP